MRKWYPILGATSILIMGLACNNGGKTANGTMKKVEADSLHRDKGREQAQDEKNEPFPSDNTGAFCGIVQISDTANYEEGFDFTVYNKDSTLWKKLRFSPELADSFGVRPYVFNYDYDVMVFRCIERIGDYYRVVINEGKGLEKLVSVHEKYLMFQTWPQHLLSVYAVEFDPKKDPLRKKADSLAATIPYDKEQAYMPAKIQGDWLQVKWGEGGGQKKGWIQWKDKAGNLLVNLFYVE